MTHRIGVILFVLMIVACTPATEQTPTLERAPSLAPSATVLPFIPEDNPNSFVGRSDPISAGLAAEGEPSQEPSLAPQATEQSIPFTVIAGDRTLLAARYFGAQADSVIILLHDDDGDIASLMLLGADLQQAGFNALVLSLRGYPPSSGQVDWSQAAVDVQGAIESVLTLPNVTRVAVLGVGRSATAAMIACGQYAACSAVILVNPVPDEASTPIEQVNIGERPLLMLVSQERADSQQTAGTIQASAGNIQLFPALTVDQLATTTPLVEWLRQVFGTG